MGNQTVSFGQARLAGISEKSSVNNPPGERQLRA